MLSDIKNCRCHRCRGNLFIEQDQHGYYITCIQCGAVIMESLIGSASLPELVERLKERELTHA
jgi:ribosomal protein S27E